MENTKKIIFHFLALLILFSCKGQEKETINNNFIKKNDVGDILFKAPYFLSIKESKFLYVKNDSIFFKTVKNNKNQNVELKKIIDLKTFIPIPNSDAEKQKINNPYYLSNPFYNYFKDSNYIYIFNGENSSNPSFFHIENKNGYEFLGGAYLKVNNKIYWRGIEVKSADSKSFKVINVQRNKSEWQASIGVDDYNIYNGNEKMTYKSFKENYFWNKSQSNFEKKYFPTN